MRHRRVVVCLAMLAGGLRASDCSRTSIGFKPLSEPFFTQYKGFGGGLYPNGSNRRPDGHEAAGRAEMAQVTPRNANGDPDPKNGKIVLLSVGMSNTTQEFSAFIPMANADSQKNPAVLLVDGAQGGWSADKIVADPDTYWRGVDQRIAQAGVTGAQVQAAWVKLADSQPTLAFPDDARKLEGEIKTILQMLRSRYPNTRLAYLSSRIYAGYADTTLNPEPYAYQGGFAVKWLIEDQIAGVADMDYKSGKTPWVAWGPYLWADGTNARLDGLTWSCSELQSDGTHPSAAGQQKVAKMLLDFFKGDTTTRPWFVRAIQSGNAAVTSIMNSAGFFPQITTGAIASIFGTGLAPATVTASLPLPYGLAGTSVYVGGEPAPLYFVSPGQINFVVAVGSNANVVVVREGAPGANTPAQMTFTTQGLFSIDGTGGGPGAARHADGRIVDTTNPAVRGEVIELYGTGRGIHNPAILIAEFLPIVHVGSATADVGYYGPAPGWPGLDQINVKIPADAPTGDSVPVVVQLASFQSNTVTLAIR